MQPSEFYYGLPQNQWDILLAKAEDLLRDQDLGSHLVGIYPAGNRIYGIESESQGIFCLYVDSVESLINPSLPLKPGFHKFNYGHSNAPIIMADLFAWTKWIIHQSCESQTKDFTHVIPFGFDVIYQDDSINEILNVSRELMLARKFSMLIPKCTAATITYDLNLLYKRATLILASTGNFYPCINPAWGKVYNITSLSKPIPETIQKTDEAFRRHMLKRGDKPTQSQLDVLERWYDKEIMSAYAEAEEDTALALKLGKLIANLYRFQL